MPDQRKPLWRRLLEFRLLFVVNFFILAGLAFSFGREWLRNAEIQSEIAKLQEQASSLEARNVQIADLNTAFRTQSFIEREARLKLGLKKPGENVVVIKDASSSVEADVGSDAGQVAAVSDPRNLLAVDTSETEVANPAKWWHYFVH